MARKSILGNKITLLECIKEKADILLGNFTKKNDKEEQTKEWKNLHEYAVEIGLVSSGRNWNYTRDKFWSGMKTDTQNKIMLAKSKSQDPKLNDADQLILQILDAAGQLPTGVTATRSGLYPSLSQESLASTNSTQYIVTSNDTAPKAREPIKRGHQNIETSTSSKVRVISIQLPADESQQNLNFSPTQKTYVGGGTSGPENKRIRISYNRSVSHEEEDESDGDDQLDDEALAQTKLRLEVEGLELTNYKTKLEIMKLEKEMFLTRSKYTNDIGKIPSKF